MKRVERPPARVKIHWLTEIDNLDENLFKKISDIDETSYPYWDKWKYLANDLQIDSKKLWTLVKSKRRPVKKINFSGLGHFPLHLNTPSFIQQQLHELDMNMGGSLQSGSLIPENEKKSYLISALMEEAIASSQLEGAATTRKLAREMLETNRKPRNHSEQMIVNNYAAMQWIVENKMATMTPELILEIHEMITSQTLTDRSEEGAFRVSDDIHIIDVQTGDIVHTPPKHNQLGGLIKEFCSFANDRKKQDFFLHPISTAIILHFLMGFIHPFADGNGRTARAIFYWYLIKKGYWLIEYMSVSRIILNSKAQYARAYQHTEMDEMDVTYFVVYNLNQIQTAVSDLNKYIKSKNREKQNTLDLLRNTDYNERQLLVIQEILKDPHTIFTVQFIESRFETSNQTARNDLNRLVDDGILQTRKNGKQIQFISTTDPLKRVKKK